MLVEEVSRVLIHSGGMNLVWFFTGTKILSRENPKLGGGCTDVVQMWDQ